MSKRKIIQKFAKWKNAKVAQKDNHSAVMGLPLKNNEVEKKFSTLVQFVKGIEIEGKKSFNVGFETIEKTNNFTFYFSMFKDDKQTSSRELQIVHDLQEKFPGIKVSVYRFTLSTDPDTLISKFFVDLEDEGTLNAFRGSIVSDDIGIT